MEREFVVVGTSPSKIDGVEKVTGSAIYAADYMRPGMLYGKIKRSTVAHARILSVDTSKALALEGVKAVLTVHDVPRVKHAGAPAPRTISLIADQYILDEKVRYFGDGVAAVAAISEEIAEEALDLIEVEYEPLPAVFDPEAAMAPDAPRLHNTERNLIVPPIVVEMGDVAQGMAAADFIYEATYSTGRPVPCYMEPNACVAEFDRNGRLTLWSSTQGPFMVRGTLSEVLGIPLNKIRVICEHMGGGFGAKQDIYQHEFLCVLLARKTGRPVKMEYTRKETFLGGKTRHPVTVHLKQGVKRDGTLTAREALYIADSGAYASHGPGVTWVGTSDLVSLYKCEKNMRLEGWAVYTNNPVAGAYRGYGAVQGFFALDCQIDEIAHLLGRDPVEYRIATAVGDGDLSPSLHAIIGDGLVACLRRGAEEIGWFERDRTPQRGRFRRGWGVGTEMHSSGAYPDVKEVASSVLRLNEDGSLHLLTGAADLGTGAKTVLAQIAAEELGISLESIQVVSGDTDVVPLDAGAYASQTTYRNGNSVRKAASKLREILLDLAAEKMEVSAADLDIRDGVIFVRGAPAHSVAVRDLVAGEGGTPPRLLTVEATHESKVAYSFGAHFVEIEVDTETGLIRVKQVVAVHEIGRAINPVAVEGQIEGGIQQGIGHSLTEDYVVDRQTGRSLNASFVDYKMPLSMDMPEIKTIILEEYPDPTAPYGAKGIGEDPIIAIGPAIANAVFDATGVRIRELPITPEKMLRALKELEASESTGVMERRA